MLFCHEWKVTAKDTVKCSFSSPSKMQRNLLGKVKCLEKRFSYLANHILQLGSFRLLKTSFSHRRLITSFKENQREKQRYNNPENDTHIKQHNFFSYTHIHTLGKTSLTFQTLLYNHVHFKWVKQFLIFFYSLLIYYLYIIESSAKISVWWVFVLTAQNFNLLNKNLFLYLFSEC